MVDIINAMEEQRIDFSFLELHIGVSLLIPIMARFPPFFLLAAAPRFIARGDTLIASLVRTYVPEL